MNFNKNKVYLTMTLLIVAGFFSCESQDFETPRTATVSIDSVDTSKGGDDEEEVIIQGVVGDENNLPIVGADVFLYNDDGTGPLLFESTDVNGKFQMQTVVGTYYFEVIEPGGALHQTNDFTISGNTSLTITIK